MATIKGSASPPIEETRSTIKEWIAVEQAISREEAAWEQKQTLLSDLIVVSEQRLAQLETILEEDHGVITAGESRRAMLLGEEEAMGLRIAQIQATVSQLENQLRNLQPNLPPPLREETVNQFQRLPRDPDSTTLGLGERMQTVVRLIEKICQFNQGITIHEIVQKLPGTQVSGVVKTLYLGLGQAYYLAPNDAGFGNMTQNGWNWTSQPNIREAILETIAIAEGTSTDLRFISLPVILNLQVGE